MVEACRLPRVHIRGPLEEFVSRAFTGPRATEIIFPLPAILILVDKSLGHVNRKQATISILVLQLAVVPQLLNREPQTNQGIERDVDEAGRRTVVLQDGKLVKGGRATPITRVEPPAMHSLENLPLLSLQTCLKRWGRFRPEETTIERAMERCIHLPSPREQAPSGRPLFEDTVDNLHSLLERSDLLLPRLEPAWVS